MGSPKWHRELKESEVDELLRNEKREASRREHPSFRRKETIIEAPEWRNVIPLTN